MYRDWLMVKVFSIIFGTLWALAALPMLIWGAWTPFVGIGIVFVMAMVISVTITVVLDL